MVRPFFPLTCGLVPENPAFLPIFVKPALIFLDLE